jgi:pilus assembly protein CpaF
MAREAVLGITERARSILVSSPNSLDQAIAQAIDEAYETSQDLAQAIEATLAGEVRSALSGYGQLDDLIANPVIEEIWINAPDQVFIFENSKTRRLDLSLTALDVRQAVERMLRDSGRRLDRSEPFVDATLLNGSRLHVVIPDVTREHWSVNIRKFPTKVYSLEDLVLLGSMSQAMANFLSEQFQLGINILVSGATQAGKTTMLCALLNVGHLSERLVSVEETFEIRTNYVDWVALQARQANLEGVGEITLRRLVKEALRMRPGRLVIGEVRQAEALDLLIALNSGIAGLCTIHANSAFDALEKLKLLPLLAGENIPSLFVSQTVERTIGLVVHCEMDSSGKRRVAQVIQSKGIENWVEVNL